MTVKIKANGKTVVVCTGSKILNLSAQDEAKMFLKAYKKLFPWSTIEGIEI
jgi:hypothetical protein